ncbi:MAG: ANTAR domain-containing protein [Candidatus Rokubacteria bacterium]|nr:ANTAR domain-containing protein [Candidatus Rokubacteria bacterium]
MSAPRWRVVVVDDHVKSRTALTAAITGAGGHVIGESGSARDAPDLIARLRPDVAVLAVGAAKAVLDATPCPIVLFTSHRDDALVRRASEAGVMAFLLKPLRAQELAPVLDLAIARFTDIQALRRELAARKIIERAKGLLMRRHGLSEEDAFRMLRSAAMRQRRPMADVAEAVLLAESLARE